MRNPKDNIYAYVGMKLPISSANINGTGYMLNEPVNYTAVTGITTVSTANANLDGTGSTSTIITAGGSGTLIKTLTIKAQGTTLQGIVRIFFSTGTVYLMREIEVPGVTQLPTQQTVVAVINEPFYLKSGYLLIASTQYASTFVITAEGMQISYPF